MLWGAYGWYEEREPGLGEEFLRCVEACVCVPSNGIRKPTALPWMSSVGRSCAGSLIEVFYEAAGDCVIVYAVFHCSQDPEKWRERIAKGSTE